MFGPQCQTAASGAVRQLRRPGCYNGVTLRVMPARNPIAIGVDCEAGRVTVTVDEVQILHKLGNNLGVNRRRDFNHTLVYRQPGGINLYFKNQT